MIKVVQFLLRTYIAVRVFLIRFKSQGWFLFFFFCFRERKLRTMETRSKNEKLFLKFHIVRLLDNRSNFPRKSVDVRFNDASRMKKRDELSFSIETRFLSFSIKPVGRVKFVAGLSRDEGPIMLIFMTINGLYGVCDRYDRRATVTRTWNFWYAFARAIAQRQSPPLPDVNGTNCHKDLHLASHTFMLYSLYTDSGIYFSFLSPSIFNY